MIAVGVSGSAGFVGGHFCRWLDERGFRPVPILRSAVTAGSLTEALAGVQAVVHLAARAHRLHDDAGDPDAEFRAGNVDLTLEIARACVDAAVRRFVFVSTAGVLGNSSPPGGFSDDSPAAPHDAYTRSKFAAEEALRDEFAAKLEVVIIRPPLVYGPGAPGNFGRLIGAVASGWPLPTRRLRAPRSMIGVRNLCAVLQEAATDARAAGLRMLVADRETACVSDLVQLIGRASGRTVREIAVPTGLIEVALRCTGRSADIARLLRPMELRCIVAGERLGWTPPYRMDQEIEWMTRAGLPGGGRVA